MLVTGFRSPASKARPSSTGQPFHRAVTGERGQILVQTYPLRIALKLFPSHVWPFERGFVRPSAVSQCGTYSAAASTQAAVYAAHVLCVYYAESEHPGRWGRASASRARSSTARERADHDVSADWRRQQWDAGFPCSASKYRRICFVRRFREDVLLPSDACSIQYRVSASTPCSKPRDTQWQSATAELRLRNADWQSAVFEPASATATIFAKRLFCGTIFSFFSLGCPAATAVRVVILATPAAEVETFSAIDNAVVLRAKL